jgi:uncharacterized protein with NRDE domain
MCTLIALHRCVRGAPLVVAANRDEYFERPAEGPAIRETASGRVLAPLDVRAGGTWLGLNEHGVFAALTNRRCLEPDPDRRSRGLLVSDMLSSASAAEAAEALDRLPGEAYNPFNFFLADRQQAFVASYQDAVEVREVLPGAHVVGNVPLDEPSPKVARVLERAEKARGSSAGRVIDELADVCREHDSGLGPLGDTCVHVEGTYGTRSSTLLRLADDPRENLLMFADGSPCRTEYVDFTPLLCALSTKSSDAVGELPPEKTI